MALVLKPNTQYTADTGAVSTQAYLRCNPFDRNDKDQKIQTFYVYVFFTNDKTKQPILVKQINVTGADYDEWFSPSAIADDKNLQDRAYSYLLDRAAKYEAELTDYELLTTEAKLEFKPIYSEFSWLQGDIWVSDELI